MRYAFRICVVLSVISLFLLVLLTRHLQDLSNQYHAVAYMFDLVWRPPSTLSDFRRPGKGEALDKAIVMAALEQESVDWVEEELPDWQRAIYIVNPSQRSRDDPNILKTPMNKGHESIAYLSYIIEHFSSLPSVVAFLHPHQSGFLRAWHVDAPLHDNVAAMRALQLDFVRQNGYVNLRCNLNPGCPIGNLRNSNNDNSTTTKHDLITDEVWEEIFSGTSTSIVGTESPVPEEHGSNPIAKTHTNSRNPNTNQTKLKAPSHIGAACCAQFAVSRDQILKRPLEDYVHLRQWIMTTDRSDAMSGRIMEYLWHIIFGKEAVYCPDETLCYCQVYGRC